MIRLEKSRFGSTLYNNQVTIDIGDGRQKMCQLDRLHRLKAEIRRIARAHNAEKVYVFGSCARKAETPGSDIDFLADFNSRASLFDQAGLELDLADLLGCPVDVVTFNRLREDDDFSRNVRREMLELC